MAAHTVQVKTKARPLGYQQITDVSSAVGLTLPVAGVEVAIINVETQPVRWRDDGTNPSSTVGMYLSAGDTLIYDGDLTKIKFLQTAASAKLNVTYYA